MRTLPIVPNAGPVALAALAAAALLFSGAGAVAQSVDPPDPAPAILADGAVLRKLATGMQFTEGPVWIDSRSGESAGEDDAGEDEEAGGGYLVFSDIPRDLLLRWSPGAGVSTFRSPSHHANGNTLDREGRLVTCEHGARRVSVTEPDGAVRALVERFEGKRLNSPNDVVVRSDGTIWFTDPPYGLEGREPELDGSHVFRFDPRAGALTIVAAGLEKPNGLCFSPDESLLYVADAGAAQAVYAYPVGAEGALGERRVFYASRCDGMRCDRAGRVYVTARDGVHVVSPAGQRLLTIPTPEVPANLCFGGPEGRTLFITARTSLYAIELAEPASPHRER